jgi:hypothetical protein
MLRRSRNSRPILSPDKRATRYFREDSRLYRYEQDRLTREHDRLHRPH